MPIYKITVPERVISAKTRVHLTSSSSPTWNDSSSEHGSSSGNLAFIELTEADRERERTVARKQEVTSHADQGQTKTEQHPTKETIIAKEIRLQMEREAELEATHKAIVHLANTHAKESGHNHGNHHGDARHRGDGRQNHAGINHHGDRKAISVEGRGGRDHVTHFYDPIGAPGQQQQHHWSTGSSGHGVKVTAHQHQHGVVESKGHGVKVGPDFSRRHANAAAAAASSAKRPPDDTRLMKELVEQRRREEELREHWKEIGMEVEERDFDATDSVFLITDDYEAPPRSPLDDDRRHHHGNSVAVTKETHVFSNGNPPPPPPPQQQHHSSTNWTIRSSASPSSQDGGRRPSTPKVQPFEEFEKLHFDLGELPYTPHEEPLIEREIRSVLMREDALRLTRGLGPLVIDDRQSRVEVVVKPPRPRSASVEDRLDLATSMKNYATNRLRRELEREKQREIDLLQLGKIQCLSEQRTGGEPLKYAEAATPDVFGDEQGTLKLRRRETSRDHTPAQLNARFNAEMAYNDPHLHHQYQVEVRGHADRRSAPALIPSAKYPSHSVSRPSSQAHTVSHGEDRGPHSTRSAAEKRIELEVLEVRRRENELKELRKNLLDLTAEKGHHDDGHVMGSSGATGHVHDGDRTLDRSHQDTSSARNRNSHDLRLSFDSDNYFHSSD